MAADLEDAARNDLVDAVLDRAGRIDILVNNAGFADYCGGRGHAQETFDRTVDHYLRVPFILTKAAVPHMRKQGAGWIVNIGSVTGVAPLRPYREYNKTSGDVIYASMKAALHRFTQGVAAELLDANVAVNCVGPSTAVRTPGAAQLIPDGFPTEPVEYLAETVLAMCHLPAAERTGLVAFSLHYPWSQGLGSAQPGRRGGAAAFGAARNGQSQHFARRPLAPADAKPPFLSACRGLLRLLAVRVSSAPGWASRKSYDRRGRGRSRRWSRGRTTGPPPPSEWDATIGAHQPVGVAELLLEHMGPPRSADGLGNPAQLPSPDRGHIARHRRQLLLKAGDVRRIGLRRHPEQQRAINLAGGIAGTNGLTGISGPVDPGDGGVVQYRSESFCCAIPLVSPSESQVHQDVTAVTRPRQRWLHNPTRRPGCGGSGAQVVEHAVAIGRGDIEQPGDAIHRRGGPRHRRPRQRTEIVPEPIRLFPTTIRPAPDRGGLATSSPTTPAGRAAST